MSVCVTYTQWKFLIYEKTQCQRPAPGQDDDLSLAYSSQITVLSSDVFSHVHRNLRHKQIQTGTNRHSHTHTQALLQ